MYHRMSLQVISSEVAVLSCVELPLADSTFSALSKFECPPCLTETCNLLFIASIIPGTF